MLWVIETYFLEAGPSPGVDRNMAGGPGEPDGHF